MRREFRYRFNDMGGTPIIPQAPQTISDLIAWASLGIPAILQAEEFARETVVRLREWGCPQPERVVWRVGERGRGNRVVVRLGDFSITAWGEVLDWDGARCIWTAMYALWDMGLCLDSITAEASTICAPPIGAP